MTFHFFERKCFRNISALSRAAAGILHQRGDRQWLIAPEYVSRGIRNIKRIPPLPRPTSTYSQILFNSSWMTSLPRACPSRLSARWALHFLASLSHEIRCGIVVKRSTLRDAIHVSSYLRWHTSDDSNDEILHMLRSHDQLDGWWSGVDGDTEEIGIWHGSNTATCLYRGVHCGNGNF